MSNTPRTNALIKKHNKFGNYPWVELCRTLEQELATAKIKIEELENFIKEIQEKIEEP